MTDMKSEIQKAFDMVDRRQNDAALQVIAIDDHAIELSPGESLNGEAGFRAKHKTN